MVNVCVIGAGAAGIAAARLSIERGHTVVVYEQTAKVGGTWVYSPETNIHSAMYEVMKTNLPKEIMLYRDIPYPEHLPSFMDHQDVLQYLEEVARPLPIQFETTVEAVEPIDPGEGWKVRVRHLNSTSSVHFDVVFVCNGHYFEPRIPFATDSFKGTVLHSHDYRRASDYRNQRVVVAGAGPSGIDIALQVAEQATEVILLGKKATYEDVPKNIVQRPLHVSGLSSESVLLSDGSQLDGIDSVIICTGYEMKFPFLSSKIISILADGQMVSPLWEHVVHVQYPKSLFFIGLNLVTVTLTLFEHQVKLSLSIIDGTAPLPSEQEMRQWETDRLSDLSSRGLDARSFHLLSGDQWDHFDHLATIGRFPKWEYHKVMRRMYEYIFEQRKINITGYKSIQFRMNSRNDDFTVEMPKEKNGLI